MCTSILFWIVGESLPPTEPLLKILTKCVSVLSFFNYATWTGERHIVGILDFVAVHVSVAIFLWKLTNYPLPIAAANALGVFATFVAWKRKQRAKDQLVVHGIALFNLALFGVLAKLKH